MRRRVLVVAIIVVVAVLGTIYATIALTSKRGEDIYLEGVNDTGVRPFTTVLTLVNNTTTTTAAGATSTTSAPGATSTSAASGETTTTAGAPGLYGGSGNQQVCDPEALIAFLMGHPDMAAAWVGALNADVTLTWSGEKPLKVDDIPAYIHELTPTFLTADTRVTNHGFFNGKATPHQSVLQAGTAVLVDKQNIPRARCACGNPLLPPKKVDNPHYRGHRWPGWEPPYCAPPGCTAPTTTTLVETPTTVKGSHPPTTSTTHTPGVTTTTVHKATLPPTTVTTKPTTTTHAPPGSTTTCPQFTTQGC